MAENNFNSNSYLKNMGNSRNSGRSVNVNEVSGNLNSLNSNSSILFTIIILLYQFYETEY